jgi:hypothetical protein
VVSGIIFCVFSSVEKLATVAIRSFSITVNPDDDGGFHIATAANISTLEKTQKIIPLTTNKDGKENEVSLVFSVSKGKRTKKIVTSTVALILTR